MRGALIIIPPALQELKDAIGGGYIEVVPGFKRYEGKPCAAFCDEDGKRKELALNQRATDLWYGQMKGPFIRYDMLVGDVAIVTGDKELMEEL